jgi:hypothetical protein
VVCRDGGPERWCSRSAGRGGAAGCRGGGPGSLTVLRASTRCPAGDVVALDGGHRRRIGTTTREVGFFVFVGASRAYSSHSRNDVFSPAMMGDFLVLVAGYFEFRPSCFWVWHGLGPVAGVGLSLWCCMVLARFSAN